MHNISIPMILYLALLGGWHSPFHWAGVRQNNKQSTFQCLLLISQAPGLLTICRDDSAQTNNDAGRLYKAEHKFSDLAFAGKAVDYKKSYKFGSTSFYDPSFIHGFIHS